MAEPRLAAAPSARLHGRRARRTLRLWRSASRRPRILSDGAGPRHADGRLGGAPMMRWRHQPIEEQWRSAVGCARSLLIYYGNPMRRWRMDRLYSDFVHRVTLYSISEAMLATG